MLFCDEIATALLSLFTSALYDERAGLHEYDVDNFDAAGSLEEVVAAARRVSRHLLSAWIQLFRIPEVIADST